MPEGIIHILQPVQIKGKYGQPLFFPLLFPVVQIHLKGIPVFQSGKHVRIEYIPVGRIGNPPEQKHRNHSGRNAGHQNHHRRGYFHKPESLIFRPGIEFDSQHADNLLPVMHRKIGNKNRPPCRLVNLAGEHGLSRHRPFHVRNALRLYGIPHITEIRTVFRKTIHQINIITVLCHFGSIKITYPRGPPRSFQNCVGTVVNRLLPVLFYIQVIKHAHIQIIFQVFMYVFSPFLQRSNHTAVGKTVINQENQPAGKHHNDSRHEENLHIHPVEPNLMSLVIIIQNSYPLLLCILQPLHFKHSYWNYSILW